MLVVDQLTIFVESSPVPLVAHPNKFIGIGILIVYAPFNVSEFWVSYTHCLSTNNDKGYGDIGCINFAYTRVKAARVVVITAVTDYAT